MLKGKHIVLGVTGSIAAYKTCQIVRLLVKAGAEVQVVITEAGKEFITPTTLSALSSRPVISQFFAKDDGTWHSHVDLGLWADAMIIAPATAATIGKMATGIADNMLITTYLSMRAPIFVAPAMDLDMFAHPTTRRNLQQLQQDGCHIIEPAEGELASHLVGKGRMEEPEVIVESLRQFFAAQQPQSLSGKRVLITAGPTYEKIDAVRFIGNYSTGKMGLALAEACAQRGAEVTVVCGPIKAQHSTAYQRIDVESADEMYDQTLAAFEQADIAICCAAVADFKVRSVAKTKIKREAGQMMLELESTRDIAAALGQAKRSHQVLVGFALETNDALAHAADKLHRKQLDCIVLNSLQDEGAGFGVDTNKITIIAPDGTSQEYPLKSKVEVAQDILNYIEQRFVTATP